MHRDIAQIVAISYLLEGKVLRFAYLGRNKEDKRSKMAENKSSKALEKRSENLKLQMPSKLTMNHGCASDPPSVISPMTELAMTFKESCKR